MAFKREQDFFWDGVDQGEVRVQECTGCGELRHPPLPRCPECGSPEFSARRLSGRGTIATWVVLQHPSKPDPDRTVGILVDMEEGVRLASNLIDMENAAVGAPVMAEIAGDEGMKLVLFRTTA